MPFHLSTYPGPLRTGLLNGPAMIGVNPAYAALHNTPAHMQAWATSGGVIYTIFYIVVGVNLPLHAVLLAVQVFRLLTGGRSPKATIVG